MDNKYYCTSCAARITEFEALSSYDMLGKVLCNKCKSAVQKNLDKSVNKHYDKEEVKHKSFWDLFR